MTTRQDLLELREELQEVSRAGKENLDAWNVVFFKELECFIIIGGMFFSCLVPWSTGPFSPPRCALPGKKSTRAL